MVAPALGLLGLVLGRSALQGALSDDFGGGFKQGLLSSLGGPSELQRLQAEEFKRKRDALNQLKQKMSQGVREPFKQDLFPGEAPTEKLYTQRQHTPQEAMGILGDYMMQEDPSGYVSMLQQMNQYDNVQIDDSGQAWGMRGGQYVPVPTQDGFTKYKPVQGTDARGMPIMELVNPATGERMSVGREQAQMPTEGEAKSIAQQELSLNSLVELRNLMEGENAPDIGPESNLMYQAYNVPGVGYAMEKLRGPLSKNEAQLMTLTTSLSNQLLAAMRGAQVGPAEQEMFQRQLPMPGQTKEQFMANLALTEKNLRYLSTRQASMRGINMQGSPLMENQGGVDYSGFTQVLPQ